MDIGQLCIGLRLISILAYILMDDLICKYLRLVSRAQYNLLSGA